MRSINSIYISLLLIASLLLSGCSSSEKVAIAQCLTDKKTTMYGTNWCGHCNATKEMFGYEAFAKINFVDCDKNANACGLAGVKGYPTWIFADGKKLAGEQTLEALAQAAGCSKNPL